MSRDSDALIAAAERIARRALDDIEDALPEVLVLVGALDYETGRAAALFEPLDRETFRVASGFLRGDRMRVVWHAQSSYAARPNAEAFAVAIELLAASDEGVLRLVDAIPIFVKWRDGRFLR